MNKLTDLSLTEFSEALQAKQSVPGGGGAAAYAGAMGIALGTMAANFTIGKKKFAEAEGDISRIIRKAEDLRKRLNDLVVLDAESFAPLAEAYKMDKNDPSYDDVMEEATLNACKAPIKTVEYAAEAIELLEELMDGKCSKLMISDVGCAALLIRAALESAALNVFINTKALKDREIAEELEDKVDCLLEEYIIRAERIADDVTELIRGY